MKSRIFFSLITFFLFVHGDVYSSVNSADSDSAGYSQTQRRRVYHTVRLEAEKPKIDGVLDDPCWKIGVWAGNFTQWIPDEGAKPSQATELKILYDDRNIYVAIRAYDNEPDKIARRAGRRDEFVGDIVGVCFDSYHDHRTGFEFDVTAAGQKLDLILTNPSNPDLNWNAVWYGKAGREDSAWTVEMQIPLSQLRYSSEKVQVWGLHCWRWIDRLQEESDWEVQSSKGPGSLYLFGELRGIEDLPPSRRIEIMPYTLGKLNTYEREQGNPFADKGRSWLGNGGLDAKIGLASNFTADLTVNPDFGQVEADPSVMNLTAFETFYEEKRPFFLEGKNIFSFDFDDVNLFYSRRIGHPPSYIPQLSRNEYMSFPENTAILSAVKVSGKTANELSVGVLQSLTAGENAMIDSAGVRRKVGVEPLTNYVVARIQQDYNQGTTMLGGIFTSTNRFINTKQLNFLSREAYTGGVDLLHQWNDKEFYVDAKLMGSSITGSAEAISMLQRSSARYYQRPDAGYLNPDSSSTQLTGYGGKIKVGKGSKGLWRYSSELNWRSPGLDLNDIGFMQTTDIIKLDNSVSYFVNQPVSIFRTYSVGIGQSNQWDFGLRHLSSGGDIDIYMEFLNNWAASVSFGYIGEALDTRLLRGGYAMLVPPAWESNFFYRTDPSREVYIELNADIAVSENQSRKNYSFGPEIAVSPWNVLRFTLTLNYSSNMDNLQYVVTKSVAGQDVYVLGELEQRTTGITFRIDYNITPELSIQYYGSPFASVGRYSGFRRVVDPGASDYDSRFSVLNAVLNGADYEVYGNEPSSLLYTFADPNFNFSQFRSNLVLRWEYLPGSELYLVWSQDRTGYAGSGLFSTADALDGLAKVLPDNIFLLKVSYWFSI